MSIRLVQAAVTGQNLVGAAVATLGTTPLAGAILIAVTGLNSTSNVATLTQTNVTWTKLGSQSSTKRLEIWAGVRGLGPVGGASLGDGGANIGKAIVLAEFAGLHAAGTQDGTPAGSAGNSDGVTGVFASATLTTTGQYELVIAGEINGNNAATAGPTQGFTALAGIAGTGVAIDAAFKIVPSIGAYQSGWTIAAGTAFETLLAALLSDGNFGTRQPIINKLRPAAFSPGIGR